MKRFYGAKHCWLRANKLPRKYMQRFKKEAVITFVTICESRVCFAEKIICCNRKWLSHGATCLFLKRFCTAMQSSGSVCAKGGKHSIYIFSYRVSHQTCERGKFKVPVCIRIRVRGKADPGHESGCSRNSPLKSCAGRAPRALRFCYN